MLIHVARIIKEEKLMCFMRNGGTLKASGETERRNDNDINHYSYKILNKQCFPEVKFNFCC